MVYVLGSWTYPVRCAGCGHELEVTARRGRGISPDACPRCESTRLEPLEDDE